MVLQRTTDVAHTASCKLKSMKRCHRSIERVMTRQRKSYFTNYVLLMQAIITDADSRAVNNSSTIVRFLIMFSSRLENMKEKQQKDLTALKIRIECTEQDVDTINYITVDTVHRYRIWTRNYQCVIIRTQLFLEAENQ